MTGEAEYQTFILTAGARLQRLREDRGLTQQQLADLVGVSKNAIYGYETGLYPPRDRIKHRLAHELGVTVDDIWYTNEGAA